MQHHDSTTLLERPRRPRRRLYLAAGLGAAALVVAGIAVTAGGDGKYMDAGELSASVWATDLATQLLPGGQMIVSVHCTQGADKHVSRCAVETDQEHLYWQLVTVSADGSSWTPVDEEWGLVRIY